MHPNWHSFLIQRGALFDHEGITQFDDPVKERRATDQGTVVCDLSPLGLIKVSGNDAQTFLQSQLTNDISEVDSTHSQLNAYCNPKGRMLALFRIFKTDESYLLQTPKELLEDIIKRLKIYIFRAQVELQAVDEFVQVGISGPQALESLTQFSNISSIKINATIREHGITVTRIHGIQPSFQLLGPPEAMQPIWDRLCELATPIGYPCWSWLDIMAGVPTVLPGNIEELIPQTVNLDLLNGISYSKGCYPGQEIVARLHYLGKIKQRMILASAEHDTVPMPGEAIYIDSGNPQDQRKVGRVVNAQANSRNGYDLLAVINLNSINSDKLALGNPFHVQLKIQPLPYSLSSAQNAPEDLD